MVFSVRITTSVYPVPVICRFDQLGDWFESLADILHWNLRKSQLSLNRDQNLQNYEESFGANDEGKSDEDLNISASSFSVATDT